MTPIQTFPAKELKNKIGSVLSVANREPVAITKNGRFSYVILSAEDWKDIEMKTPNISQARDTPKKEITNSGQPQKKKSWGDFPLFGMWKDREDMKDPVAYVQNLRKPRYTV